MTVLVALLVVTVLVRVGLRWWRHRRPVPHVIWHLGERERHQ